MTSPVKILIFAQHTTMVAKRSGIQRVVLESALALGSIAKIDFVKWDARDGQLRYFDQFDLANLWLEDCSTTFQPHPQGRRMNYRFGDTIDHPQHTWVLFPEIPFHLPNGNEIFSRTISQCQEYGIKTAAIFYDLIPIRDADYQSLAASHIEYAAGLLNCDLILPISNFSGKDLYAYYKETAAFTESELETLHSKISPVPLGEFRIISDWFNGQNNAIECEPTIILLGAVEPRKQQTRFLKVFNDATEKFPHLKKFNIELFGSLHSASKKDLLREMKRNTKIKYHKYTTDEKVSESFSKAMLSVFPSRCEGYGLPIIESLRRGVPCMTANFGSMAEVAQGGGCLMVDVLSDAEIADGIVRLTSDSSLITKLRKEIINRNKRSWTDYANDILLKMESHIVNK